MRERGTTILDWLDALVPGSFPGRPASWRVIQTHISVVIVTPTHAFKLKKPVRLPILDYTTVGLRLHQCSEEVRLNRRLCPKVYEGTCAVLARPDGKVVFDWLGWAAASDPEFADGTEHVVDHAVVMQVLPADRMLDVLLEHGAVTAADLAAVGAQLAHFHATCRSDDEVRRAGSPSRLAELAAANFRELRAMEGHGMPPDLLDALAQRTGRDFQAMLPLMVQRMAAGRVRECHGDVHARNVCMTTPPAIYDCIEFSLALRAMDTAAETAFLAMDLRYRGSPHLVGPFLEAHAETSGDREQFALMPVLVAYRAMVRAKVALLAAADPGIGASDRSSARRSALRHLHLAAAAAVEGTGRTWLVLCGPPASGKSSLAAELAERTGWTHLATDVVRKQLAGLAGTARGGAEHYTEDFTRKTYGELLARAALATSTVVLLDGNFPTVALRAMAAAAARPCGATVVVLHVDVDEATALHRATERAARGASVSDADAAVTARRRAQFVRPARDEGLEVLDLDGAQPATALADHVLAQLLRAGTFQPPQ